MRDALQAQLGGSTWPAFNVADVAIVVAMLAAAPLLLAGQREAEALPDAPPQRARLD
jgi:lipoprotein signal peptidase